MEERTETPNEEQGKESGSLQSAVDALVMPTTDSIRAVVDGIFTNSQAELLALDEAGLDKFWHFSWSENCDFAMNLYRFHKAVTLYGNFCRRWEELHNGTCCVVERVRDKYLIPKFQMLIEMVNFSPEDHCRKLGKVDDAWSESDTGA